MDKVSIAKELTRFAGALLGPGIPDGTGPWGGTPRCPMTNQDDEEEVVSGMYSQDEIPAQDEDIETQVASELVKLAKKLIDLE